MSTYLGQPDRDLQCYFQTSDSYPYMSAAHTGIAAITKTSPTALTLTGTFHDQFDWSVIEWNRDNQYEHLALRPLPKGDLTGLTMSYREKRSDVCVQPDSGLYDWQDWSRIRIFCGKETQPRKVRLAPLMASGPGGAFASVTFNLTGSPGSHMTYSITVLGDLYESATESLGNSMGFTGLIATENGQYFKVALTGPGYTHVYEYTSSGLTTATGNVLTFTFSPTSSAAGQYVKIALTGPHFNHIYEFTSTAAGQSFAQELADRMTADSDCPMTPSVSAGTITLTATGEVGGSYQASCFNVTDFIYHDGDPWWNWNDTVGGRKGVAAEFKALMDADPDCPVFADAISTSDTPNSILGLTAKGISGGAYQASCWVIDHFQEDPYGAGGPWWDWNDVGGSVVLDGLSCASPQATDISIEGTAVTITARVKGTALNGKTAVAVGDIWDARTKKLSGGATPDYYTVTIPFDTLHDEADEPVPVTDVRAIRWTYCPNLVNEEFTPVDYTVEWSYYSITGSNAAYKYAGKYSQVIHCEDKEAVWSGYYEKERGNFVGGAIAYFDHTSTSVTLKYNCPKDHDLYVGSRFLEINGTMKVTVDGGTPQYFDLFMTRSDIGWDRVCRLKVGSFGAGKHTVVVTSKGETLADINPNSLGYRIFFNYVQCVVASDTPVLDTADYNDTTLATDYDTAHSLELNPQRVVWNLRSLGFKGRTNHYVGALKWYKLASTGGTMAHGSFQIGVTPDFATAKVWGEGIGLKLDGLRYDSYIQEYFTSIDDVADDFIDQINSSSTSMWAYRDGITAGKIFIVARHKSGGSSEPNGLALEAITAEHLTISTPGDDVVNDEGKVLGSLGSLAGGVAYKWVVDKDADEPVNAATAAWTKSYMEELHTFGMSAVLALSQELAHEPQTSPLAARYSDGQAVWLNTPALQTNFSPATSNYFKKAFKQLAQVMSDAGVQPFLQFGECQWWYFATRWDTTIGLTSAGDYWQVASSLGVYDSYTMGQFTSRYGGAMHVFRDDYDRDTTGGTPKTVAQVKAAHPYECEMLASLIGEYTSGIINYVKATLPTCKFEVLYPLDVNDGSVPNNINQPPAVHWGSAKLDAFKTEGFGYMFSKNLAQLQTLIKYPFETRNFTRANSRCLLGSYDNTDPFERALMEAKAEGTGDKVLWAFDQFSMRSFRLPLYQGDRYVSIITW